MSSHASSPAELEVGRGDDDLELWVDRTARLVLHAAALADRYEHATGPGVEPAARARVARLRRAAAAGRDALGGLMLERPRTLELAVERLVPVLSTRAVIRQAQGVLMQRYGVSSEAAMAMLQTVARDRAVTVGQAAGEVTGAAGQGAVAEPPGATSAPPTTGFARP